MKSVKLQNEKIPSIALGTWSWGTGGGAGGDAVFGNYLNEADLSPVFDAAMKAGFSKRNSSYYWRYENNPYR